eukprot:473850-Prymnesium_polylepis.1
MPSSGYWQVFWQMSGWFGGAEGGHGEGGAAGGESGRGGRAGGVMNVHPEMPAPAAAQVAGHRSASRDSTETGGTKEQPIDHRLQLIHCVCDAVLAPSRDASGNLRGCCVPICALTSTNASRSRGERPHRV